jgi:hypothetical protein
MAADAVKPESKFSAPEDKKALVTWAQEKLDCAYKLPEYQGKQNLAFFLGHQHGVWNKDRSRFDNPRQHRGDNNAPVRVKVNKIAGLGERVIARLLKSTPIPECRPVTDTNADVNSAKFGTRILSHESQRLSLEQKLLELYFWVVPLGDSFFHVRWDPDEGPLAGTDEETGEPVAQGEIMLDEVPSFELRWDPNARRYRDAKWCVRSVAMTKEACFEQYGRLPVGGDEGESLAEEWRFGDGTPDSEKRTGKFVAVHQLWMLPSKANPKGLVLTWSGKTVLEDSKDFPYNHKQLPFVPFNLLPALGAGPTGRTWVTDLVAMQRDYNDARSREAAIRRVMTPKILAARGQIDPGRLTSRVEVIDYNPTGPEPKWMHIDPNWMAQYETAMNRADAEMGERAGQGDASSGNAASSAPAASIMALQEADETKLAISAKELAASIEQLGFQILMLVKQFWVEERMVRTWSRDGELEVKQFTGSDLGEQLDVHVSSESALPRSKSARVQMAIDLWSQQIISDPRIFLRLLDLPGTDLMLETLNLDAKQAEREHASLYEMQPVEAKMWHNHQAHIATHLEEMKTEEYEQKTPEQQAWFEGHLMTHFEVAQGQAQQQINGPGGAPPAADPNAAPSGTGGADNGQSIDPLTGRPSDPLAVAAGLSPSSSAGSKNQGVVGGTGNPGAVPGQSNDAVAGATGN